MKNIECRNSDTAFFSDFFFLPEVFVSICTKKINNMETEMDIEKSH